MIQVLGESLIDIIVGTDGEIDSVVGGAPINTARAISRLGCPVSYLGGISSDSFGRRIQRLLEQDGVAIALSEPMREPSAIALASLDSSGAATYRFLIDGTAASAVTVPMAMEAYDSGALALHIGTLAFVLNPLSTAVRPVIDSMPEQQILMVDPNARPSVMSNSTAFQDNFNHALKRADIIKVSGDDLLFIFPGQSKLDAAIQLHETSGAVVLFTDGADSINVFVGGEHAAIEVPRVNVVDTVGAGDSFSGGFLAYWFRQSWDRTDLADLAKVVSAGEFGSRVASLTCQVSGAQPPFADQL